MICDRCLSSTNPAKITITAESGTANNFTLCEYCANAVLRFIQDEHYVIVPLLRRDP